MSLAETCEQLTVTVGWGVENGSADSLQCTPWLLPWICALSFLLLIASHLFDGVLLALLSLETDVL